MKNTILTLIFTTIGLFAICQKNDISIGVFSPIMTNSMKQYFTDEWILEPSNNYSRKYLSLGYNLNYERKLKEFNLGMTLGIVTRSVNEKNEYNYFSGSQYFVNETFEYRQLHYLSSLHISKYEEFKKIRIGLKIEIPFVYYGKGTNNYYKRVYSYNPTDYTTENNEIISSGFSTGLGLGIKVQYKISDKVYLGLDISEYLLITNFKKPTTGTYSETYPLGDYENYYSDYNSTNKYQQVGFSRIVPYFSIGYEF